MTDRFASPHPRPRLFQFFAAYFHQDCLLDDPDWQSIVRRFRNDAGEVEARVVAEDLRVLLADETSDANLHTIIYEELGCSYDPRPDLGGPTLREWLEEICRELRAP